jgi:membrane-associated phospholipid phosphatase
MKLDFMKTLKEIYSVILKDTSAYGGFPFYGLMILAFVLVGAYGFALNLFLSLVVVTLIVAVARLAYFRPRPGQPRRKYKTLYERIDNSSFPSIHAARAVMISIMFYRIMPVMLPILVLLVVAVLLSRIHFKRHDWKDLAAGIVIGLILSYAFF